MDELIQKYNKAENNVRLLQLALGQSTSVPQQKSLRASLKYWQSELAKLYRQIKAQEKAGG